MREILTVMLVFATTTAWSETNVNGRRSIVLDSKMAQVVIDISGGSIVDFHFKDQDLNPLVWEEEGPLTAPRPMGHFLCLDRWGAPSEAEAANGMPFHGEAARVEWKIDNQPTKKGETIFAEMSAVLPMAGLSVRRWLEFAAGEAVLTVTEEVTNTNKLGRIYNMVQHPTIGPPFLDETTVVDANARRGFMQSSPLPNPEVPSVVWPQALKDTGQPVNMRHLSDDMFPNVVSYTIDQEYGWTTASNAAKGLLIGYIWKSEDYPWFDAWRHVENGKPVARGLEFGTTGLHQPVSFLVKKGQIFGRSLFAYIDAGQSTSRSFTNFLLKIPTDYKGVADITYADGQLVLRERGGNATRDLTLEVGAIFGE